MREALAERLLAQVMEWTPEDVARERPILQAMAAFKYDEYQQFSPGMRFVESLALWLSQFTTNEEKKVAYQFVQERLVFFSDAEIAHFISVVYPNYIRPLLIQRTATQKKIPTRNILKITQDPEFLLLRRRCLFLGLSDGARIDAFRRSNPDLSHEQIRQTYELTPERSEKMLEVLRKDLNSISGNTFPVTDSYFRMIFLLDDFSGSGISYLRREEETAEFAGKIHSFYKDLIRQNGGSSQLINPDDLYVGLVIYVATDKSRIHLEEKLELLLKETSIEWGVQVIQPLGDNITLKKSIDPLFHKMIDKYYDPKVEDEHKKKGGVDDVKHGFAGCSLPVVLNHNTPNNSIFLLWSDPELYDVRGLFPRVSRF